VAVSICSDTYQQSVTVPRRIRVPECSAFQGQNRWVNFCASLNLTPDPEDNDVLGGLVAWTLWDLPVTVAFQDVSTAGNDLAFVAIGGRVYVLDWERYRDEFNWEAFRIIQRQLTIGPIPGTREDEEDGKYSLSSLKRFRRFTFELATDPLNDPTTSEYRISVNEPAGDASGLAQGTRVTQRHGNAQVAKRGYSFLVRLEHDANEDFPLLWWSADFEELGDRRANDSIVSVP